jgi:hypothetical protein
MNQPEARKPGRPRKFVAAACIPPEQTTSQESESEEPSETVGEHPFYTRIIPADWGYGALLNVRNAGETYNVTLYPEEFDPRKPERTLKFTNSADCQNFVSNWYSRQAADPRAR